MKQYQIGLAGCLIASVLAGCCPCLSGGGRMADHVVAARTTGRAMGLLTSKFDLLSVEQAYEVQDKVTKALVDAGDPVAGYKIGFAGAAAQRAWGLDEPAYGRLHKSMAVPDGGTVNLGDYNTFHMEVEVAFVLARRIDKPIEDISELRAYVKSVHPGFDLPSNRFRSDQGKRKIADVIADDVGANRFVLGPAMDPDKIDLAKLSLVGTHDGTQAYAGPSSNVMGNPWNALRWLANTLQRRGLALEAGDVVLSGAVTKMYSPAADKAPGTYAGDCGPLGRVSCKVVPASE